MIALEKLEQEWFMRYYSDDFECAEVSPEGIKMLKDYIAKQTEVLEQYEKEKLNNGA